MNIQEYISSGIVESYVLGLAEKEERAEFERMCLEHAEVRAARDQFEIMIEQQASSDVAEPPAFLKNRIAAQIASEFPKAASPVIPIDKGAGGLKGDGVQKGRTSMNLMRLLVAASVILLIASTGLNIYFFRQYRNYSERYASLLESQRQLADNNQVLQSRLHSYESDMAIIKNPDMEIVKMPEVPTSPAPGSLATVYWNQQTKDVYLLVNNMPQPAADKQFQLWALVDGKPVDAGVFDMNTSGALVKMKNIPRAQQFAITLEKRGGSAAPTMEQLYVLGAVKT